MAKYVKKVKLGDKDYEETLLKWFDEAGSDCSEAENDDEVSLHDTDSEISEFEDEDIGTADIREAADTEEVESVTVGNTDDLSSASASEVGNTLSAKAYYGKNRFKWSASEPAKNKRTPRHNLVKHLPGLRGKARDLGENPDTMSVWNLIFSDEMLEEVRTHSNSRLARARESYSNENRIELQDLDMVELKAFLGLLYFTAIFKSNNEDLESLFSTDGTGRDIFRATMSLKRMLNLLNCLRFDNADDRVLRKLNDKAAAVSFLFSSLVSNSQECYSPGELLCIDEMLVGFRGRCQFRMYMGNKPNKYGLKVMILCDARTSYFFNGYIYTGKGSDGKSLPEEDRNFSIPTQAVLRLAQPVVGSNRNVTADNWFSSVEVVEQLRKRNLTYVGTLKKNKREIPPSFLPNRNRPVGSAKYGFTKDTTLLSFVPKKGKAVMMISSMHHCEKMEPSGKPEIIEFYNYTKGGVDSLDQKCMTYSTSRRTRRWTMAIFFAILDIASVNSYVLYKSCAKSEDLSRLNFMKKLSYQLVKDHLSRRFYNERLPRELRLIQGKILKQPLPSKCHNADEPLNKRKRCQLCPRSKDKKTNLMCESCHRAVCRDCLAIICKDCNDV